jgi:trimethylamine--corrinoid protein Co-methyltransferase
VFSLWAAIMGGGNVIQHAAGWMEGGLVASYEKFVLDADLLQMVQEFLKPVLVNSEEMGRAAMREVGPGGHFFGAQHTLQRYATAFYQPLISDWRNFQNWEAAGSPTAATRANALWKQALAEYQLPPFDADRLAAIDSFVARRVAEGGEKTDF